MKKNEVIQSTKGRLFIGTEVSESGDSKYLVKSSMNKKNEFFISTKNLYFQFNTNQDDDQSTGETKIRVDFTLERDGAKEKIVNYTGDLSKAELEDGFTYSIDEKTIKSFGKGKFFAKIKINDTLMDSVTVVFVDESSKENRENILKELIEEENEKKVDKNKKKKKRKRKKKKTKLSKKETNQEEPQKTQETKTEEKSKENLILDLKKKEEELLKSNEQLKKEIEEIKKQNMKLKKDSSLLKKIKKILL